MKTEATTVTVNLEELANRFPDVEKLAAAPAWFVLGPSKEHLVKETVNRVLIQFWKCHQNGSPPKHLSAWVRKVTPRLAYQLLKTEEKYSKGLVEELSEEEAEFNGNYAVMPGNKRALTPAATSELNEKVLALRKLLDAFESAALTQLGDADGLLFELRYKRGLSCQRVAFELGMSEPAVRKQWSRLLEKVLDKARTRLNQDPACADLLSSLLANEEAFHDGLLGVLRVVMHHGVSELERLVHEFFAD